MLDRSNTSARILLSDANNSKVKCLYLLDGNNQNRSNPLGAREEIKRNVNEDEKSLNLSLGSQNERHFVPIVGKEVKRKSNKCGPLLQFMARPNVHPPSEIESMEFESQEEENASPVEAKQEEEVKEVKEEDEEEHNESRHSESEHDEPHKEEEPKMQIEQIMVSALPDGYTENEELKLEVSNIDIIQVEKNVKGVDERAVEMQSALTEGGESLADEDEIIRNEDPRMIELDPNLQSNIRNVKLQQLKFASDAANGLSYEQMSFVTTRVHPYVIRKKGKYNGYNRI